jgi:hypothetical protein
MGQIYPLNLHYIIQSSVENECNCEDTKKTIIYYINNGDYSIQDTSSKYSYLEYRKISNIDSIIYVDHYAHVIDYNTYIYVSPIIKKNDEATINIIAFHKRRSCYQGEIIKLCGLISLKYKRLDNGLLLLYNKNVSFIKMKDSFKEIIVFMNKYFE